ncbi:MAG: sortase [Actinomycetota bacterium]
MRPQRRATARLVRYIGIFGRVFVGAGLVLLFFTGYLLWGTGVYTKQAQKDAAQALEANPIVTEQKLSKGNIPPARPPRPLKLGEPLFTIKIPKIGLENTVVEGVDQESLRKGVGHFPGCDDGSSSACLGDTKYPGESGNVALSGHRTTYGAPFFRVNELSKGDTIDIVSGRARYRYRVREQKVVDPITGFSTVEQHGRDELTLTTCHPRFSAAQRLIISADYEGASLVSAAPRPAPSAPIPRSDPQAVVPPDVLLLASIALASALGALGLSKRYRNVAAYITLGIAGAAGLWVGVFPRVLALMPANY